jgi:UDP-GlcNAc:undecaprenyl-phosphate GlcNAc-1-phosphate transferase
MVEISEVRVAGLLIATFACVVLLMPLLRPLARRIGLLDRPGGRKTHVGEIPLIGGIAISLGLTAGIATFATLDARALWFLACVWMLVVVGVLDDRYNLTPKVRIVVQCAATLIMIFAAGVAVSDLGALLSGGAAQLGSLAVPFTLLLVLTAINAFNMFDGSDGVAAGQAVVACAFLGLAAHISGSAQHVAVLAAFAGGLLGFLVFNWPSKRRQHVRVFMGDAGSTAVGFILAWMSIELSQGPQRAMSPVAVLWIFALPVFDLFSSMLRRLAAGRSPLSADDEHLHHVLRRFGLSSRVIAQIVLLSSAVLAGIGVAADLAQVPGVYSLVAWLLLGTAYHIVFGSGLVIKRRRVPRPEPAATEAPSLWVQRPRGVVIDVTFPRATTPAAPTEEAALFEDAPVEPVTRRLRVAGSPRMD